MVNISCKFTKLSWTIYPICSVCINRHENINPLFQEYSDDEEERRVKRAENAKRKAASAAAAASDGEVVAVESDDSRQGAITRIALKLHQSS